jgi:APA family basic amino acid/polyamine antiporter
LGAGSALQASDPSQAPTRLARRLGAIDAVIIGLGSMLGAGVFVAIGPAAAAAGSGLLIGLVIAGAVAYCNATSSAQLAALYPESGGTYIYGKKRLGEFWGFLAGWAFVAGKTASCAAIALTFGFYLEADFARPLAIAVVVGVTAVNLQGIEKTALATRVIVALVLTALAVAVTASLGGGQADLQHLTPLTGDGGLKGILESGGLLFFAFAGYARLATLGEEVRDPETVIPRAVNLALGITLVVYGIVASSALLAIGPERLAKADAPLVSAAEGGDLDWLAPLVSAGAVIATLGVLLSLLVGLSRTVFAMSSSRHLPSWLEVVHPQRKVPYRAELAVAVMVIALIILVDLDQAIGFSSFTVLTYYAIANAAAYTLSAEERRWPRLLTVGGVGGCLLLAFTLPAASVAAGAALVALGVVAYAAVIGSRKLAG